MDQKRADGKGLKVEDIIPEKYKFMDIYESLKNQINTTFPKLSEDEEAKWFVNKLAIKRIKNKKSIKIDVNFIEALPEIVQNKTCTGILFCLHKEPKLKIAELACKMGKFVNDIQRARRKLEAIYLIIVYQNVFTRETLCYLNDGKIKKNGYQPVPKILDIVFKLMEKKHGSDKIKEMISVNKNVQKKAEKRYRQKKKNT